jgi:hypothetical protein
MKLAPLPMVAAALALAACGSDGGDVAAEAYRALAADMTGAVETYGQDMAAVATQGACEAVHAGYHAHMLDAEQHMLELSATMDEHMAGGGHMGSADAGCVAHAMADELAAHHQAACTAGDVATDRAAAAHHVEVMSALLEHQRQRAGGGASTGMMGGGHETFACARDPDGSFTFDGHHWEPGCLPGAPEGSCPAPMPHH